MISPPPLLLVSSTIVVYVNQPAGIAGLGLKKFSHCLVSYKLHDAPKSSSVLSMDFGSDSDEKTRNLTYTPLLQNPIFPEKSALSEYYYVGLRRITVDGDIVDISHKQWSPDSAVNGGTIVDSSSTFTYMTQPVFDAVTTAFAAEVKGYKRAGDVESAAGLRPCFIGGGGENVLKLPELKLHFNWGLF